MLNAHNMNTTKITKICYNKISGLLRIVASVIEVCAVPVLLFSMGSVKFHSDYFKNVQVFLRSFFFFFYSVQVRNYMVGT
jgi:hypothetical protein